MTKKARGKKKEVNGLIMVDVDNPHYSRDHAESQSNPKKTRAAYNYRESPVAFMHVRGYITDEQARAGIQFRLYYELQYGTGPIAIDWRKEPVDGGGRKNNYSDLKEDARRQLDGAKVMLGKQPYKLVERVCGQCIPLSTVLKESGNHSKRAITSLSKQLQGSLDTLAVCWGIQRLNPRGKR